MGKAKRKQVGRQESSPNPSPEKGVGSPSGKNDNLSKEDQQRVIDELKKKLDAASKTKSGKNKRSAIGGEDESSTDEDDQHEEPEKDNAGASQSAGASKSASSGGKYSKLGNRATKARKLFKDKDEEEEFRAWKASRGTTPLAATPVPVAPVQTDEALAT